MYEVFHPEPALWTSNPATRTQYRFPWHHPFSALAGSPASPRRYPYIQTLSAQEEERTAASPETVPMAWGVPPRPPSSKVQALYELCKRTFPSPSTAGAGASPSPPPADTVRSISSLMGNALLPAANFDPFPFLPLRCGLWACCDSLMARPRLAQFFILFHYAPAIRVD